MRSILFNLNLSNFAQFGMSGQVKKAVDEVGTKAKEVVDKAKQGLQELFKK